MSIIYKIIFYLAHVHSSSHLVIQAPTRRQITPRTATIIAFIIVREVAKLEPPLINLVEGTEEGVLQVTAKVDFYGQDMTNNVVKATGYLNIFFANYTDN